ncbi:TIGR03557 family F420-dependent LLM class oxidoreductase [Natrinema sp. 74]|uniref:TIGR03557 family F420-dependent LLM class oxidoreductase n=1 Tax=Natrinema sp. 74 TaxID=3384159 RepID=UPI0038D36609
MVELGINLASEAHGPTELVEYADRAEEVGLDFAVISDHYHPWIPKQDSSSFVWSTIGAIADRTDDIELGTAVTCPTVRIHPAIIAQAAATAQVLMDGRFFLGLGTGEQLNEHILGDHWPPHSVRLEMLEEAVTVIRDLWEGDMVTHHGNHYTVENAQLFTLPEELPEIVVSALGPETASVVGQFGDGFITTSPNEEFVERYEEDGDGPIYGGTKVCWGESDREALETAVEWWPNAFADASGTELPTPKHYEEASQSVGEDDAKEAIAYGPNSEPYVEQIQTFVDAGFERVYLHHLGQNQKGFIEFMEREVLPEFD